MKEGLRKQTTVYNQLVKSPHVSLAFKKAKRPQWLASQSLIVLGWSTICLRVRKLELFIAPDLIKLFLKLIAYKVVFGKEWSFVENQSQALYLERGSFRVPCFTSDTHLFFKTSQLVISRSSQKSHLRFRVGCWILKDKVKIMKIKANLKRFASPKRICHA